MPEGRAGGFRAVINEIEQITGLNVHHTSFFSGTEAIGFMLAVQLAKG